MGRGWRIGRLFGIDIVIDAGLVALAALLVWALYVEFRSGPDAASDEAAAVAALAAGGLFFGSILAHEMSHSLMARRKGIAVNRIRLFFFGGVSELESEPVRAADELAIAGVGPATSLVLAAGFWAVELLIPDGWGVVDRVPGLLAFTNAILAGFNLVPGFPLDGGRVLRSIVWRVRGDRHRATRVATAGGRAVGIALMGIGVTVMLMLRSLAGLWYLAIGWFLHQAALAGRAQAEVLEVLEGRTAADLMEPVTYAVPAALTLEEWRSRYVWGTRYPTVPVDVGGRVRGLLGPLRLRGMAEERWAEATVGEVMERIGPEDVVPADLGAAEVVTRLGPAEGTLVVVAGGRVVGVITTSDLARRIDEMTPSGPADPAV